MLPSGPPTEQEIWKIARRTTDIIESNITNNVCLFGSAASSLWADIGRVPHDIDIVVSEDPDTDESLDPEDIKEQIVEADHRYFLEQSRKRGATYQILYCRLPGWSTDTERCVKVDILVPPTLKLPNITEDDIFLINNIPVMPLFDLLVMKTQGWWTIATRLVDDDVSDVIALLESAREEEISYDDEADEERHSSEFMNHARVLANRF
ncbi:hypothetical protein BJV77DRAFT_966369, partial [Russula vinacea]